MKETVKGIKIAITGKGGVGKTTLSALLCHLFRADGKRVIGVDADPDANLGMALGFSDSTLSKLTSIAEDRKLIKERTGAEPGVQGQMFALNPQVSDIPDRYVVEENGIKLLQMGHVTTGGAGCACPESTLLKHLLRHLVLSRNETLIVDMEAGLEHLGRGTSGGVDAFIVVVEPGQRSIKTAKDILKLAEDLGIKKVYAVISKVHPEDVELVKKDLEVIEVLGYLPYDADAVKADLQGKSIYHSSPKLVDAAKVIKENIVKHFDNL